MVSEQILTKGEKRTEEKEGKRKKKKRKGGEKRRKGRKKDNKWWAKKREMESKKEDFAVTVWGSFSKSGMGRLSKSMEHYHTCDKV